MVVDRRTRAGTAVISARRFDLGARLLNAGVGARFLLPQTSPAGIQLPALYPPLLLDTRDLGFVQSAALLVELATWRPVIPTIVLVDPDDVALMGILRVCPAIYAILADTANLRLLGPLIRLGGVCGSERMHDVAPYWAGVPPLQRAALSLEGLQVLVALARAETIDDAVDRSGMARRTFYRRLARLRISLGLPRATHGMRIEELVPSLIAALANVGQTSSDMPFL